MSDMTAVNRARKAAHQGFFALLYELRHQLELQIVPIV